MLHHTDLSDCQIHHVLANPRRRAALERLAASGGVCSLRALAAAVAAAESGTSPPPPRVRASVYTALHQTHLPLLHDLGVVAYDRERKEVRLLAGARAVNRHMGVVAPLGVTWREWYRSLGVVGLTVVVASLAGVPVVSLVDPLLWASGSLALFVLASARELWGHRWYLLRGLRPSSPAADAGGEADAP